MADDVAGAVRRTSRPTPYPRPSGDHQTPETAPQVPAGATNTATPVSQDPGTGTGQMGDEIAEWIGGSRADVDQVVAEYAALPDCTACGGSGKDDHASAFEAPLAVHFAGPPVKAERRIRQLCMWCGHVLIDNVLIKGGAPVKVWDEAAFIKIEDGLATEVHIEPGAELPPGCCALPDDDYDRADDGLCEKCVAPAVNDSEGLGLCRQHLTEHYAAEADAERRADDEPDDDGPDEAQETRAAADWPAEPVDERYDEEESDRA